MHNTERRQDLVSKQEQIRTEQKKQNRTSESWDRLGSDGTGEKGTTGDFKEESSGFMMVWMQEEQGMCVGRGGRGRGAHMPQILQCATRIITTGK